MSMQTVTLIPLLWTVTLIAWSIHLQGVCIWNFECFTTNYSTKVSLSFWCYFHLTSHENINCFNIKQPNKGLCCFSISQYALISLVLPTTVKSSINATSLLLCSLIKMNLFRKWIKWVTPRAYIPIAVRSPCVVPSLDFISWFPTINNLASPHNNSQ